MSVRTVAETAEYLRCSKPTVYRLIRDQGLPVVRLGADMRIRQEDLDAWLESRVEK